MDRFKSDVLDYNPDIVIIGFGTNDAHIDNDHSYGPSRIPLTKYRDNLEFMIQELLALFLIFSMMEIQFLKLIIKSLMHIQHKSKLSI